MPLTSRGIAATAMAFETAAGERPLPTSDDAKASLAAGTAAEGETPLPTSGDAKVPLVADAAEAGNPEGPGTGTEQAADAEREPGEAATPGAERAGRRAGEVAAVVAGAEACPYAGAA